MKAIVAEIDKKQMIVITDKGDFVKIKRQMSAAIGDEIEFNAPRSYAAYKRLVPVAACLLACIFLSTGVYAYYTPYSYVSVDINQSIAMSLNRFQRVISVDAITEDAAELIKDAGSLKNQEIDKALSKIIKSASDKGYIDEKSENQVMVVVSAKDPKQEKKLAGTVNKAATKELSKVNKSSEVTVAKTSVESYKEAVSNKVSPGKEILEDKLRKVNPGIKDEEVKSMTVKEAMERINEGRKAAKEVEKNSKQAERDKKKEQTFQGKNNKDGKDDKETAKGGKEAEKGSKMWPAAQPKDNKAVNGNKDKTSVSEKDKNEKNKKGADWGQKTDKGNDKDKDKDRSKDGNKDNNKDNGKNNDKTKKDKDDKDNSGNKNNKGKQDSGDKSKKNNSQDLGQRIKDMMQTIKGRKSR